MGKAIQVRDRSKLHEAMVRWCAEIEAKGRVTMAAIQGVECMDLPCYPYCSRVEKGKERE